MEGVTIALRPGSVLTGRLIADTNGPPPSTAAIRVSLVPFDRDFHGAESVRRSRSSPTDRSDSTACSASTSSAPSAPPGRRRRRLARQPRRRASRRRRPPDTWFMTAVTLDGRSVIDVPLEFDGRPVDVAVSVTTRPAVVSGQLPGRRSRPPSRQRSSSSSTIRAAGTAKRGRSARSPSAPTAGSASAACRPTIATWPWRSRARARRRPSAGAARRAAQRGHDRCGSTRAARTR